MRETREGPLPEAGATEAPHSHFFPRGYDTMCERLSTCQQLDVVDWDFGHILEMGGRKEEREAGSGSSRMRTAG